MLPQGAPTSPALSNIYLRKFDESLGSYCQDKAMRYTRYADDLSISFKKKQSPDAVISFVNDGLIKLRLKLNESKTKVMEPSSRQVVTGIIVNDKIQIPRYKRKQIRLEVFFINKFGLANHLKRTNNNKANYLKHLLGKINYALYVNPKDEEMKDYKKFIHSLQKEGNESSSDNM